MSRKPVLNVALVGYAFMGRAHSNAWNQVGRYFDIPYRINKQVIIGRSQGPLQEAADNWGWANTASSLEEALEERIEALGFELVLLSVNEINFVFGLIFLLISQFLLYLEYRKLLSPFEQYSKFVYPGSIVTTFFPANE